jgi:hypothetical protein
VRTPLATLAAVVALAVIASAAPATPAPGGALTLSNNHAKAFSRLFVDFDPRAAGAGSTAPRALFVDFQRGTRFDPRGRKRRCNDDQARKLACPRKARVGSGLVEGTARGSLLPGGRQDFAVALELFVAKPRHAGDLADIIAQYREPRSGRSGFRRARVLPLASGPFGVEVEIDIPPVPPVPGVTVELNRVRLSAGGTARYRKVRRKRVRRHGHVRIKRVVRKRRRSLITNPRTCAGSWAAQLRVQYADHTNTYDAKVPCQGPAR